MRVFYGFDKLPEFHNSVVSVGSFDGVHIGHRALLNKMIERATEIDGESIAVTFYPHPRIVVDKSGDRFRLLNSLTEKKLLLEELGVDNFVVIPFTHKFSRISSDDFIRDYIIATLGAKAMVVGDNHHFGYRKGGSADNLSQYGPEIITLQQEFVDDQKVSSTIIRTLIENGDMKRAEKYLAKPYFIVGRIDCFGNISLDTPNKLLPPEGEYEVTAKVGGESNRGILSIDMYEMMKIENRKSINEGEIIITF